MKLWVGLGNPGARYAANRHNIGWMAVERIAADHGFSPWRAKFQGSLCEGVLGGEKTLLLRPETFMNLSGQSVGETMRFYKLEPTDITVWHDEIDLAPAKVRVKAGGGHAGHNGLRSIHQHVGPHYDRVRLGIGHPGHKDRVAGHVLGDFAKSDQDWLDDVLRGVSDGAPHLAQGDPARFLNAVALRTAPPRSSGAKPPAQGPGAKAPAGGPGTATPPEGTPPDAARPDATPPDAVAAQKDAARTALQKLMDRFR